MLHDNSEYDKKLEIWWRKFAVLRTRALHAFLISIPLVFMTMACQCYISHQNSLGIVGFLIFFCSGVVVLATTQSINKLFREDVLALEKSYTAPIYFSDRRVVFGASNAKEVQELHAPNKTD